MHLENNPMFKKTPVRWLDASIFCIAGAFVMLGIALFAIAGIRVAAVHPGMWLLWVPLLLLGLSTGLFLCLVIRFSRNRRSEK